MIHIGAFQRQLGQMEYQTQHFNVDTKQEKRWRWAYTNSMLDHYLPHSSNIEQHRPNILYFVNVVEKCSSN